MKFADTSMELVETKIKNKNFILSEVSQTQKDEYDMYSFICGH